VNRDALGILALAVLAILAIAVGAAAIDAPTQAGGSGPTAGSGSGVLLGEGQNFDLGQSVPDVSETVPFPTAIFSALAVAVLAAFLVALYVLRDELGMDELKTVAVLSLVLGTVLTVFYFLLQFLGGSSDRENGSGALGENVPSIPGGGGGSLESATRSLTTEPPLLALAIAAALLIGVALVRTEPTTDDTDNGAIENGPARAELGRAAGRAADRIAGEADVNNEVYRAWREMTEQLGVADPRSRTPGEFARAATDAGMAREDVAELTGLFRTVRYGGTSATDEREARAVAALRRIEDEYAEGP
jgi:hypothetical protein